MSLGGLAKRIYFWFSGTGGAPLIVVLPPTVIVHVGEAARSVVIRASARVVVVDGQPRSVSVGRAPRQVLIPGAPRIVNVS